MPRLLKQGNADLARNQIWVWSIPAHTIKVPDGRVINTCPAAGMCASTCFAKRSSYNFKNVFAAHVKNLLLVEDDLEQWEQRMSSELSTPAFRRRRDPASPYASYVRIHDGGDFYSDEYLQAWLRIAADHPDTLFYAYTKEVRRFKRLVEGKAPENLRWLYSLGGKEDRYIDRERDRHCDVFPNSERLEAAGYSDQGESDLLSIMLDTTRIGIVVNNHRDVKKHIGEHSFGEVQADRALRLAVERAAPPRMRVAPQPEPEPEAVVALDRVDFGPRLKPQPVDELYLPEGEILPRFNDKGIGTLW